jgi:metal-sulfur cluster biosynthetic enzyme
MNSDTNKLSVSKKNITKNEVYARLKRVIDPELQVDVVGLGLIYQVEVKRVQSENAEKLVIFIVMTLTTPGCPLAGVIEQMIRDQFCDLENFDSHLDLIIELTFDPPWIADMMSEEARAELGL